MTRVVWELNPAEEGDGTLLVTGSHKAVYPASEGLQEPNSPIWDSYTCPAGSLLFFTEALTHSGRPWTNTKRDRVAIFSCYNTVNSKWHNWDPNPESTGVHATDAPDSLPRGTHSEQSGWWI
ncbi:hypothetical protein KFU94_45900 [Chloroflexi bacterium TSY]|nr:hypothetical protein [Chloroflexi bacterium TSY]